MCLAGDRSEKDELAGGQLIMDQDAIWDYFQNEAGASFAGSETRLGYLAGLITPSAAVLNIGVGGGTFETQAIARGLKIFSLDPNTKSIERLRERYSLGDRARVGYSQQIPFPDCSFDAVVLSEVLEHLSNDVIDTTLREVQRVLRTNGRIIGTVPARENLAAETVVCPDCSKRFHRWGHAQSFTCDRMRELLAARFTDLRVWERPFVPFRTLNWKGKIQGLMRLLLYFCGFHGEQENIVFLARRRDSSPPIKAH